MFTSHHHPAAASYHTVDLESSVHMTDPHRLVEMLFDGAVTATMKAAIALKQGNITTKGQSTTRAIRIIDEGLKASLDHDAGEISSNLSSLYTYMCQTLLEANLHNNLEQYEEVTQLLQELRDAWRSIRPQVMNLRPNA